MNIRTQILGGVALAGLMLAGPAMAADPSNYYNTNPTQSERQQTNALNSNAADNARDNANQNDAANTQYRDEMNNYDARHADYERARARYENDRAAYNNGRSWDAYYGHEHFRDVYGMRGRDLIGVAVITHSGDRVGQILNVDFSPSGRLLRVGIRMQDGRVSWVKADDVRYDSDGRVVRTDLSRRQIDDMSRMGHTRF